MNPSGKDFTRAIANTPAQIAADLTGPLDEICEAEKRSWKNLGVSVIVSVVFVVVTFGIAFLIGGKLP